MGTGTGKAEYAYTGCGCVWVRGCVWACGCDAYMYGCGCDGKCAPAGTTKYGAGACMIRCHGKGVRYDVKRRALGTMPRWGCARAKIVGRDMARMKGGGCDSDMWRDDFPRAPSPCNKMLRNCALVGQMRRKLNARWSNVV